MARAAKESGPLTLRGPSREGESVSVPMVALHVHDIPTVRPQKAGEVGRHGAEQVPRAGPLAIEVVPALVVRDSAVPVGDVDLHMGSHGSGLPRGPVPR